MKSSSGEHYLALDHVRAIAVFLVFSFHFLHGGLKGIPVPFEYKPSIFLFPISIINQGHTGVAMFMTLSGYLFAKLLDGKRVNYLAFYWNRALRLFPLLFIVIVVCGIQVYLTASYFEFMIYVGQVKQGWIKPTLPNGAWSVMIEMHFYLLLPVILYFGRRSKLVLPAVVLAAIALRALLHYQNGEVQSLAYLTIVGRIDQFVLGILAFNYRRMIANRHVLFAVTITALLLFFWWFKMSGTLSPSPVWIILPTVEGLAYSLSISYYDNSYRPPNTGISKIVGYIGAYSYSIYLLHFFVVYYMCGLVMKYVNGLSNFYVACLWSLLCFLLMLPIGYLSFRYIESPFLKFRRRYTYSVPDGLSPAPAAG